MMPLFSESCVSRHRGSLPTSAHVTWSRFDSGDRAALDEIEKICLGYPGDAALSAFAVRLRETGPGGSYALREK